MNGREDQAPEVDPGPFDPEQAEAEFWAFVAAVMLGAVLADVLAHPAGATELARRMRGGR